MKLIVLVISILYSFSTFAIFDLILEGYKSSNRIKSIVIEKKINDVDNEIDKHKYDWSLNLSGSHSDSNLQSLYSFSSQQTIISSFSVVVAKPTFKYGVFSFGHERKTYDLSHWSSSALSNFNSDEVFEGKNFLRYELRLLDDSTRVEWKIIETRAELKQVTQKLTLHQDYYDFFQAYIAAKTYIFLDRLYKDFEDRAFKRVRVVKRRVRDALARSVDLTQAKLSLLNQKEIISENQNKLSKSLAIIEDIIQRKIEKNEYEHLKWSFKKQSSYHFLNNGYKNLSTEQLIKSIELTKLNTKKVRELNGHKLDLTLSSTRNAFENSEGEAVSSSFRESDKSEQVVSLKYTVPLGSSKSSFSNNKKMYQDSKSKIELMNMRGSIKVQIQVIKASIIEIEKNIKIAREKNKLSKKLLSELDKLYRKGQKGFEDIIRAEENLISSNINLKNLFASHELKIAELSFLTGNILNYLEEYVD